MLEQLVGVGIHGLFVIAHEKVCWDALLVGDLRRQFRALLGLLLRIEALLQVGDLLLSALAGFLRLLELLRGVLVGLRLALPAAR